MLKIFDGLDRKLKDIDRHNAKVREHIKKDGEHELNEKIKEVKYKYFRGRKSFIGGFGKKKYNIAGRFSWFKINAMLEKKFEWYLKLKAKVKKIRGIAYERWRNKTGNKAKV